MKKFGWQFCAAGEDILGRGEDMRIFGWQFYGKGEDMRILGCSFTGGVRI